MHSTAVFQRTDSGRTEIKTKMHGLTQSERLALIVVDGVTQYSELRQKLKGLAEERFDRALNRLLQKSLIFEVLLAGGDIEADVLDTVTVDRFLYQDPLDPVTIISFDPEDDFGLDIAVEARASESATIALAATPVEIVAPLPATVIASPAESSTTAKFPVTPGSSRILTVDIYLPLERTRVASGSDAPSKSGRIGLDGELQGVRSTGRDALGRFAIPANKLPWGQLMIAAGIIIIVMSVLVKLAH